MPSSDTSRDKRLTTPEGKQNGIGEQARERRLALGLTQFALAGRLASVTDGQWNCSESEIAKIEAGNRRIIDLELRVLAKALNCSAAFLWGDEDAPVPDKPRQTSYSPKKPRRRVYKKRTPDDGKEASGS